MLTIMREFYNKPKTVRPAGEVAHVATDLKNLPVGNAPTLVWFGHSSYLISHNGYHILADPVFSGNISPVGSFGKAFSGSDSYSVEDLPPVDLLVFTHDHYDHLDYKTILQLRGKVKRIVAPLGLGAHLEYWGMPAEIITELDWWESHSPAENILLTALPARHYSGRFLRKHQTLWAAYTLEIGDQKWFLGGDSGYGIHFPEIGRRCGPFDLALIECGQYGQYWPQIHMTPEETVKAALDIGAKALLPIHWSKFALANHAWDEPVERVKVAAKEVGLQLVLPKIGEVYQGGKELICCSAGRKFN